MNYELFLMIPAHSVAHHCPTLAENRKSITESTGHNRQGNDNLVANAFLEWKMDSVTTLILVSD